ncbi:MAG TPA: class II aldolase/adducin family protein [Alphaproteobacteria bacterium]|jgi:ribulose-5-phosphate 4-epimerase/fuculose-1-phosphate aldolase|nr:class II aldolase/adducin family protein [Alphaproteobacteria bacterium]
MSDLDLGPSLAKELETLALACRVLAMEGHDDVSLGHLSLRDPEGRGFWMKRFFLGLDEIMGPDDFVLLDFEGKILAGQGERHSEWPIHSEILLARDDVNVVGHSHPFHACLFAATQEELAAIGQEGIHFAGNTPHYRDTSDLIDTKPLGQDLVAALGDAKVVFMKNHGVTFCGPSIADATITGIYVEKACRAQLVLNGSGLEWSVPERSETDGKAVNLGAMGLWANFFAYYVRKLLRHEGALNESERRRAETMSWTRGRQNLS